MATRDLAALWEAHCRHEFETRDVDATMATMAARPYVNHIPTMTGGVGQAALKRFYKYHFIGGNPPDTELRPVSRTVGVDQIVDEMVFCFTHTCEIDWMLPGVPPTGKRVEVPLVAIVRFEGDKIAHEHLLGSGLGAGAVGPARSQGPAGRRHRDRAQGRRQYLAQQRADDALGYQRRQADLMSVPH